MLRGCGRAGELFVGEEVLHLAAVEGPGDHLRPVHWALCRIAFWKRPADPGATRCAQTLVPPAGSPNSVTFAGPPPNAAALRFTHREAACWSSRPQLPDRCWAGPWSRRDVRGSSAAPTRSAAVTRFLQPLLHEHGYPLLASMMARDEYDDDVGDDEVEFGLDRILDGIEVLVARRAEAR
ncbi:hypothetical protein QFZ63_001177 [Streptomyces sp. B3I7]|nr:hypothetical protein [Streptomyces sp. B3I7]